MILVVVSVEVAVAEFTTPEPSHLAVAHFEVVVVEVVRGVTSDITHHEHFPRSHLAFGAAQEIETVAA
jgi:hypothetical protein